MLEDDAVVLPGGVSVLNDALRYLESDTGLFGNWDILYAAHCGECLWWADALTDSSTARLGGGLAGDEVGLVDDPGGLYAARRAPAAQLTDGELTDAIFRLARREHRLLQ